MKKVLTFLLVIITVIYILPLASFAAFENTHVNTGNMAADLIAVAQTQLGYMEGSLEGTVQGSNDCTKYGKWYGMENQPWCAMFVSWCAAQADIPNTVIPRHASCDVGMNWFKNNGRWEYSSYYGGSYTPKVGDIAYYGYKSGDEYDSTHVGIVYKVDANNIYSIEGNSSAKVQTVPYSRTSAYVLGYGLPAYGTAPAAEYEPGDYVVTATALNMRENPDAESGTAVLTTLVNGTKVTVTAVQNEHWGKIEYNGRTGWISLSYCNRLYKIRYDANGGSSAPSSQTKEANVALTLSSELPVYGGHEFVGWATDSRSTTVDYTPGASFYTNSDTVLYAVWKTAAAVTYTVSFDANGGAGAPASMTKTQGVALTLPAEKPSRDGYVFTGWALDGNAVSPEYAAGGSFAIDADTKLFAVWGHDDYGIIITTGEGGSAEREKTDSGVTVTVRADKNYCISSVIIDGTHKLILSDQVIYEVTFTDGNTHTVSADFAYNVAIWDNPYEDVPKGKWYYDAVQFCYMNRLMTGTSDTTFSPSLDINRGSFMVLLGKIYILGGGTVPHYTEAPFPDVSLDSYYGDYVAWAKEAGLTSGSDNGMFNPSDRLTREQLALILYRAADFLGIDDTPVALSVLDGFNDRSSCSSWAEEGVAWAVGNGLIAGSAGSLMPRDPAARSQTAQIMYSMLG